MLDLKFIRENKKLVEESIRNRGIKLDLDEFLRLDEKHRRLLVEVEGLKAERNKANDEITALMKSKKKQGASRRLWPSAKASLTKAASPCIWEIIFLNIQSS